MPSFLATLRRTSTVIVCNSVRRATVLGAVLGGDEEIPDETKICPDEISDEAAGFAKETFSEPSTTTSLTKFLRKVLHKALKSEGDICELGSHWSRSSVMALSCPQISSRWSAIVRSAGNKRLGRNLRCSLRYSGPWRVVCSSSFPYTHRYAQKK